MDKFFNAARFGEKLKKHRLKKHLSQMELAEKIDLQTSSVSHLENGTHNGKPPVRTQYCLSMPMSGLCHPTMFPSADYFSIVSTFSFVHNKNRPPKSPFFYSVGKRII